jgi:uncharacterized protein YwgA
MNETQKNVVLLSFIELMRAKGSWCGETHVQKGTYFFQELVGVPLEFAFILYKHGPYSFDLKDQIAALRADLLLTVVSRDPYGPSIILGENSPPLLERFPKTRERFHTQAEFVASHFASRRVAELERLATALFVTRNDLPDGTPEARAARINKLKPHVSIEEAHDAVKEVDRFIVKAQPSIYRSV